MAGYVRLGYSGARINQILEFGDLNNDDLGILLSNPMKSERVV